eukprot:scaffold1605_cov141-Cylindrotheca_fusiformis.AAC.14
MQLQRRVRSPSTFRAKLSLVAFAIGLIVLGHIFSGDDLSPPSPSLSLALMNQRSEHLVSYDVDDACKSLPFIRPAGSFFLNSEIKKAPSPENVDPQFHIGSFLGNKATWHMKGDRDHFLLIKELLDGRPKGGFTLDIGANQGFYTYYLAALGMDVHAFEIYKPNFNALQHGAEFNPKEIAKHVYVYPVGMGKETGRVSMGGSNYEGHLKKGGGNILASTYDCFAYHNVPSLGTDIISNVAFVKIDVEGFEIAVLAGAKKSLFGPHGRVGGLLMEVGPSRWDRAGGSLEDGIKEMKELSTHFKDSYLIARTSGSYAQTCPKSLADEMLSDPNPRTLKTNVVYKVKIDELEPLLKKLKTTRGDCNFWYTNS